MGKPKYKVACVHCGRQFSVPALSTPVPKHPGRGERKRQGIPGIPCDGSGLRGNLIKPSTEEPG